MNLNKNFIVAGLFAAFTFASAETALAEKIMVSDQHARPSLGVSMISAGFLTLMNKSAEDDKLISAQSDVSERVELHTHIHDNGVMRMRPVKSIAIKAKSMTMLKPGGFHIMFIKTKNKLKIGDHFKLKLNFEKSQSVTLTMPVTKIMGHGMTMKKKVKMN